MKKILIAISLVTFILSSCEKGTGYVDPSLSADGAKVKFINASWNAPSTIFYGSDTTYKFSSALIASGVLQGTTFGSTYPSNDYAVIAPYSGKLQIRIPTNATVEAGKFFDLGNINIENAKNYSIFIVDSFPTVTTIVANDDLKNFNVIDTFFSARFVNAVFDKPTGPTVDIFSKNENAVIFSNVPYKGVTAFKEFKIYPAADEIQIRLAGTATILAKLAFTPVQKKTYTWFGRGRNGHTVAPGLPVLSFYTNQ